MIEHDSKTESIVSQRLLTFFKEGIIKIGIFHLKGIYKEVHIS